MHAVQITTKTLAMTVELDDTDQLADMQKVVGGNIEPVYLHDEGVIFWVNEDGIGLNLPLNYTASILAGQPLLGNVLVTGDSPTGMHIRPVPGEYRKQISWCLLMQCNGYLPMATPDVVS